jgi:hypothetical protein
MNEILNLWSRLVQAFKSSEPVPTMDTDVEPLAVEVQPQVEAEPAIETAIEPAAPVMPDAAPVEIVEQPEPVETPLQRAHREAAEAAAVQWELDTLPVDWDDETRTDLPQRTRGRIQFILPFESTESDRRGLPLDRFTGAPALTTRRIQNDIVRRAYGGGVAPTREP